MRGTVSMARAQSPDSANSQFFICFDDASFLDRQYTVWGKVVSGMENVDKIKRGEPVRDPDKIVKATHGLRRVLRRCGKPKRRMRGRAERLAMTGRSRR